MLIIDNTKEKKERYIKENKNLLQTHPPDGASFPPALYFAVYNYYIPTV